MPRDIPVGNGEFLITFDRDYCLRDIYYPCAGKENHSDGHKFRFGLWADGKFAWVDREWRLHLEYAHESLMSHVTALSDTLGVNLHCNDIVDFRENIYIKQITLQNQDDREREFRLFFHHDFHILESPAGDTAYYDPDENAVIHYKANRYFLMSGMRDGRQGIDQYATGVKEFRGREGTWKDAEDGRLSGNPITQGSVDSTISIHATVPAGGMKTLFYWICAGENYADVNRLNRLVTREGPERFIERTDSYWRSWVNKEKIDLSGLAPKVADLYTNSLFIIRSNVDNNGAIIAANDSDVLHFSRDTYSYMWPRDGAFTACALDRAGYFGIGRRFFEFCRFIIEKAKGAAGYFHPKYSPEGYRGSSWHPWVENGEKRLPIQEDGTGLVLWALWHHFERSRDIEFIVDQYERWVIRCADFLESYRDPKTGLPLPSYDLWEERRGIHTFTVSAVYAGLTAAEKFSSFFGETDRAARYRKAAEEIKAGMDRLLYRRELKRFVRSLVPRQGGAFEVDGTVDSSLYAPFYFGVFDARDERVVNTMEAIAERLLVKTDVGGIARYEGDAYYRASADPAKIPGNPWFICTLWLAQWHIARAETMEELNEALPLINWVASRALPSGVLAEQVHPFTDQPLSVSPLTWSHAAFVTTVLEYLEKRGRLGG